MAWGIAGFVAVLLYCIPMQSFWNFTQGRCFNFSTFFLTMETIGLVIDVIILALPLRAIANLQLPRDKRIVLGGIFLLGGL